MPPKAQPRRQQPPRGSAKGKVVGESSSTLNADDAAATGHDSSHGLTNADNSATSEVLVSEDVAAAIPNDPAGSTQPTTSAIGSPPHQPVQRLASLNSRRRVQPPRSTSTTSEVISGRLKIQPKSSLGLRRSKESREALHKAEAERQQARLAKESDANSVLGNRGDFQGRGGRGMFTGNRFGSNRFSSSQASGHLGGGTIGDEGLRKKRNSRGGLLSKLSEPSTKETSTSTKNASSTGQAIKPEKDRDGDIAMRDSSARKRPRVKQEDQILQYATSDEEPDATEGPRINIEHINLISDGDSADDIVDSSGKGKVKNPEMEQKTCGWNLKPVRVDRHEHVERSVGVNTDASLLTSAELRRRAKEKADAEESLFLNGHEEPEAIKSERVKGRRKPKDVEFVRDERRWKGVYQDEDFSDGPNIKDEPREYEPVLMDKSTKAPQSQEADVANPVPEVDNGEPSLRSSLPPQNKHAQVKKTKLAKPVLQTEEDRQEWDRYENDLSLLREEFSLTGLGSAHAPSTQKIDENEAINIDNENVKHSKDGLVYLFQLPPIMPKLLTFAEKEALVKSKEEKGDQGNPPGPSESDLAPKPTKAKPDTSQTFPDIAPDPTPTDIFTASDPARPVGKVGKLRLYDTGRVKVDWGGVSMELGRGGNGGQLQELVLTDFERTLVKVEDDGHNDRAGGGGISANQEEVKEKWEEKIGLGTKAWAVGELAGGFVMTPDWDKIFNEQ